MPQSELPETDTKDSPHFGHLGATSFCPAEHISVWTDKQSQSGTSVRALLWGFGLEIKGHLILQTPGSLAEVLLDDSNLVFS